MSRTMDSFRFPEAEITDDHDQYNLIQHHDSHQIIIIDRDLYDAAKRGEFSAFIEHKEHLDHLLTPHKCTILHIHINSRSDHDIFEYFQLDMSLASMFRKQIAVTKFKPISTFVEEILAMCPSLLKISDARGDTPLHIAARKGDAPAMKALINCGKSLELDTERGVQGLRTEMLRTKNEKGDTALHEAVRLDHLDVAEILSEEDNEILCYGNEAGKTPLHLALKRQQLVLFGFPLVLLAIKGRHRHFMLKMLDNYHELQIPDCGDRNGRTLLHEVVISEDEGITRAILRKSKDLCKQADKRGWVPLHHAAQLGNISIVKALLECDPHAAYIKDKNGRLPFQVAHPFNYRLIVREIISCCPNCYELVVNDIRSNDGGFSICLIYVFPILKRLIGEILFKLQCHENNDVERFNQEERLALRIWRKTPMGHIDVTTSITLVTDKAKELTVIVATLVATVTFAAGFTLPGGYVSDKGPQQGSAVLKKNLAFKTFVIADTIAMVLSTLAVCIHVLLVLRKDKKAVYSVFVLILNLILCAVIAMLIAFMTGIYAVLGASDGLAIAVCVIVICCSFLIYLELMVNAIVII